MSSSNLESPGGRVGRATDSTAVPVASFARSRARALDGAESPACHDRRTRAEFPTSWTADEAGAVAPNCYLLFLFRKQILLVQARVDFLLGACCSFYRIELACI